ncbi:hypothetical protein BBP00_00005833 [Phytophthora kernoviae]|uniref:U6 small nuclear RNA (adenine-(43)-N(6))-methyltransferase n=1 Tax=Phytophthora kernoviae TaxID=325452 RepID=A0A3F2RMU1_9STRA|nr:hypothetical protein BBP00_00005833 [Phytophthora kernoviae]
MAFLKQHVVILASTTNKELLDPAILRPGRFDVHIHVDFPDEDARCALILQALQNVPVDYSENPTLGSAEALASHMAKRTSGMSAGDLPNRLNYLHWIEDLLNQVDCDEFMGRQEQHEGGDQQHETIKGMAVSGIDVGTGANCIYPLLGAAMNRWHFIATEIDNESYTYAKENVDRNQLQGLIAVKRMHTNKLLTEPLQGEAPEHKFHFVMCNPPFFDDMSEADTNPDASCMGSANEMVFPGGEIAFIGSMIDESMELQDRVLWFTSMIGRKSSLRKLLALLREKQVPNTRTTEFFQGRTKRWGIAWTFSPNVVADPSAKVLGKRKEAHRRQEISFRQVAVYR